MTNSTITEEETSLGNMVKDFLLDSEPQIDVQQLNEIIEVSKTGDISYIMRVYENSIKHPIRCVSSSFPLAALKTEKRLTRERGT